MIRKIEYIGHDGKIINAEIQAHDDYKIPESIINKSLMIAMNYLTENIETEEQESAD